MENTYLSPLDNHFRTCRIIGNKKLLQIFLVKICPDTYHYEKLRNFKEISEVTIRSCTAKWMFLKM